MHIVIEKFLLKNVFKLFLGNSCSFIKSFIKLIIFLGFEA